MERFKRLFINQGKPKIGKNNLRINIKACEKEGEIRLTTRTNSTS